MRRISCRCEQRCYREAIAAERRILSLRSSDVIAQRSLEELEGEYLFACDVALRIGFPPCSSIRHERPPKKNPRLSRVILAKLIGYRKRALCSICMSKLTRSCGACHTRVTHAHPFFSRMSSSSLWQKAAPDGLPLPTTSSIEPTITSVNSVQPSSTSTGFFSSFTNATSSFSLSQPSLRPCLPSSASMSACRYLPPRSGP